MAAESSYYSIDDDELNECGEESECPLDDSNVLDSHRFADLPRFVQLVEDNLDIISDPERFEEGWRRIFAGGKEAGCDWADEDWTSGENLWKQLQFKANNFRKYGGTSKGVGMRGEKYENIVRFLMHNEYPQEIRGDGTLRCNFKKACESYFLHGNGLLGYRKRKYVLLEGELEDVIQDIHLKLGHAPYGTLRKVVESHFFADCALANVVKQLSAGCNVKERTCSQSEVDHVSLHVERSLGRISLKLFFKGSLCEKSTKECCQISSTETGNIGGTSVDEKYKHITAFLRYGIQPEDCSQRFQLRNRAKDYKWTKHGLMRNSKLGELLLVLRESEAAGVIQHLHEIYGHPCAQKMKALFDQHFYYSGFYTFCRDVLTTCRLCLLRQKCYHRDVTPAKLYENAKYDVDVKWEGEKRIISIHPVGLDTEEVEKYVSMIEKKYGARNKDKLPAEVDDLNAPLYEKVLSVADFTLGKGDHSFTQATKKTSVCEQLMHDKTIPDVGTPSMAGNCERFSVNTSGRKSMKRKASSAIHHSPSAFSNGSSLLVDTCDQFFFQDHRNASRSRLLKKVLFESITKTMKSQFMYVE